MEQNSIVVKNVTKKFDDFMLDHISFTVPTGRIVGFIGENGAGKSTTINLILDQLKLDAGEIRILGKQNHSYLHKENIGVVFDECKFHSVLNAKDIAQGGVLSMDTILSFMLSILAGVITYYICKWLDRK